MALRSLVSVLEIWSARAPGRAGTGRSGAGKETSGSFCGATVAPGSGLRDGAGEELDEVAPEPAAFVSPAGAEQPTSNNDSAMAAIPLMVNRLRGDEAKGGDEAK